MSRTSERFDIDETNSMFLGFGTDGMIGYHLPSKTELQPELRETEIQMRRLFPRYDENREASQIAIPFILCRLFLARELGKQLKPFSEMGIDFLNLFTERLWCISTKELIPRFRLTDYTPEIKNLLTHDRFLRNVLDKAIPEIYNLESLKDENFLVSVSIDDDVEIPEWREFVLSVKVRKRDFTAKMKLWESLEQRLRAKIEEIRDEEERSSGKGEAIDRINQNLSIEVVEVSI